MVKFKITKIKIKPKEKLIKYLIENKVPKSTMQVSGAIILDYKNTYNLVNELQSQGIIFKEHLGNTNLISINLFPNQEIFNVEKKRTEEFLLKNPKLKVLRNYIEELNYPFLIALIFGSHAKGINSLNSDIDLCIICDNTQKLNVLCDKLRLLALPLEIHEFSTEQFVSMIEKKQNNLGHEIINKNIILYGTENYYNIIAKWMKKE
ncbi:MAG: nucleotidyltransferase domain-containing protein [Nanoarchaeota archaeon]